MKKFNIPLIDYNFFIYSGKKEWPLWIEAIKKDGCSDESVNVKEVPDGGRCFGSWIWVSNSNYKELVYHEVQHFLDLLFEHLGCEKEREFKANLAANVIKQVHKWIDKKAKKKE